LKSNKLFVFAFIAQREVDFFLEAAKVLNQNHGLHSVFVSFFQPGNINIEKAGFEIFDLYTYSSKVNKVKSPLELEREYNISNLQRYTLHERVTFGIDDLNLLYLKYSNYLQASQSIIIDIKNKFPEKEIIICQELGGFIAPLSLFFASQSLGVKHFFYEPSFFKGRLHFNLNTLSPLDVSVSEQYTDSKKQVSLYLEKSLKNKSVVIPSKDKHHFTDMRLTKLINPRNISNLIFKIKSKFIYKHKQEYEHILNHVKRYSKMLITRKRNSSLYTKDISSISGSLIYYPFHVQLDYSITTRSPQFLNQYATIENIAKFLPPSFSLIIKEHPASIGEIDHYLIKKILADFPNIYFLHPKNNTYDILDKTAGVITINSKVGAEAASLGKKVYVLGEAFYSKSSIVTRIDHFREIEQHLLLNKVSKVKDEEEIHNFFSAVWDSSIECELYNLNKENINKFASAHIV